jgi:hypothetical protein
LALPIALAQEFLYTNTIRHRFDDGLEVRNTTVDKIKESAERLDVQVGDLWDEFFVYHEEQIIREEAFVSYFHHAITIKLAKNGCT